MSRSKTARRVVGCAALLVSGGLIESQAQQAPVAPAATPASAPADEEIVILSPFVVEGSEDQGYLATQTLVGTRLRSNLRDVASSISVVTETFMNDIGATTAEDLLVYTTNTEIGGTRGNNSGVNSNIGSSTDETGNFTRQNNNVRIRGLSGVANTRDLFLTDIPGDGYNIGRWELQRGPNSILFGLGQPAGVMNTGLNQAAFRSKRKIEFQFDQHGTARTSLDLNQVLLDQELAVRVSALDKRQKYQQAPTFEDDQRIYGALRYDPKFLAKNGMRTSFRVNYEHGDIKGMRERTLPPIDRLSPWFNEQPVLSPANPLIGKPAASYPAINRAVYDNWDMMTGDLRDVGPTNPLYDPSVGFVAEAGRNWVSPDGKKSSKTYVTGYVQNPYYQPFISEVYTGGMQGFIDGSGAIPTARYSSGGTLQHGFNQNRDIKDAGGNLIHSEGFFNYRRTPLGLEPDGNVGYFRYAQWQTIAEPWKSYRYMQLPFGGSYRDPSFTDRGAFDFINHNLDGDNRRNWRGFDFFSGSLDQTFFNNRVGVSLAYAKERYNDGSHSIFNDRTQTITVDVNATFPNSNEPNPNAGRAMMMGDGNYMTRDTKRDELRATAFAELHATDLLRKSWLTDVLGKHIFTGMASETDADTVDRSYRRFMLNPSSVAGINKGLGTSGDATGYRTVLYLTPDSMQDRTKYPSLSSLNLQTPSYIAPESVNLYYFDSHWKHTSDPTKAGYVNPNALWTDVYNGSTTSRQRNNPANYVGWSTKNVRLLDATNDEDRPFMQTSWDGGLSMNRRKTSALAFVWQGFLFNDCVVPTFGYREDNFHKWKFAANAAGDLLNVDPNDPTKTLGAQSGIYRPNDIVVTTPHDGRVQTWVRNPYGVRTEDGFIIPNSPNIRYQNPAQRLHNASRSWSVVGYLPRFIRKHLPWGSQLSIGYNESNNFNPEDAGRVNIWGELIPPSSGKTRDVNVTVSMFDNKVNLRVTKYHGSMANTNASGLNLNMFKEIETRSWIAAKKMWDANTVAKTKPYDSTEYSQFENKDFLFGTQNPNDTSRILYSSQAEKDELVAKGLAFAKQVLDNAPTELLAAWNIDLNGDTWRNVTDMGSLPAGSATMRDQVTSGYEYELTLAPLNNWRISANYSTTEAAFDRTFNDVSDLLFERNEIWSGPQGDFHYGSPARMTSDYRSIYATQVMSTLTAGLLANGLSVQEALAKTARVVTSYDFRTGIWKGVSVGGACRWEDKKKLGFEYMVYDYSYTSKGVQQTSSFEVPNLDKPVFAKAETNFDAWIGYKRKLNEKIDWRIQLNVRNLGQSARLTPITTQPDGSIAQYRITEGQRWTVTNTFEF